MDNDCDYGNFNFIISFQKILHKPGGQNCQETHCELKRIVLKTARQSHSLS